VLTAIGAATVDHVWFVGEKGTVIHVDVNTEPPVGTTIPVSARRKLPLLVFTNPGTAAWPVISFGRNVAGAKVSILNMKGEQIDSYDRVDGDRVTWNSAGRSSGVYVAQLHFAGETISKAFVLTR